MRFVLAIFTVLLTLAAAVVVLGALIPVTLGTEGSGVVVGGAMKLLIGLLIALSALFVVLLIVYRRRARPGQS